MESWYKNTVNTLERFRGNLYGSFGGLNESGRWMWGQADSDAAGAELR